MRRVLSAIGFAVFALAVWSLSSAQDEKPCDPPCKTCLCFDGLATTESEPDSTMALMSSGVDKWGLGAGIENTPLTLGLQVYGDRVGAWLENALERKHSGTPRGGFGLMSIGTMRDSLLGYVVSAKSKSPNPAFRLTVMDQGKVVWTSTRRPAGTLAMVDQWPSLASGGRDRRGLATCGWGYSSTRAFRITRSGGRPDTTVLGDEIRVALEGAQRGVRPAILRLQCSARVDSIRVPRVRAGLFNRTAMK